MAASLYKLSDMDRRWVKNMVWVSTGYWRPDPLPPHPVVPPSDPIDEGPAKEYGWIGYSPSHFGLILPGMTLHSVYLGTDPDQPYTPRYVVYYDY